MDPSPFSEFPNDNKGNTQDHNGYIDDVTYEYSISQCVGMCHVLGLNVKIMIPAIIKTLG